MKTKNNRAKKIKAVKARMYAYAILNHLGTFWAPNTFTTEEEAQEYLDSNDLQKVCNLANHKVVPVLITPIKQKPRTKK